MFRFFSSTSPFYSVIFFDPALPSLASVGPLCEERRRKVGVLAVAWGSRRAGWAEGVDLRLRRAVGADPSPSSILLLHEIKPTSVAGPQCRQAGKHRPKLVFGSPEVCEKGKCGMSYLIRTYIRADMNAQAHAIKHNRIG